MKRWLTHGVYRKKLISLSGHFHSRFMTQRQYLKSSIEVMMSPSVSVTGNIKRKYIRTWSVCDGVSYGDLNVFLSMRTFKLRDIPNLFHFITHLTSARYGLQLRCIEYDIHLQNYEKEITVRPVPPTRFIW